MSLTASHIVPASRELVWEWHTRPGALARLSPPFLSMTPIQQAQRLSDGTTIFALPAGLKWVSRHDLSAYRRGFQFTDVCTSAPFKAVANWRHIHSFEDHPEGTLITDSVSTRLPAGSLAPMFSYRQHQLIEDIQALGRFAEFSPPDKSGEPKSLVIAMTGSRGLIGRALSAQLTTAGHQVIQLVRKTPKPGQRLWDEHYPEKDLLAGVDVLVHLAGEPISGRFNEAHKKSVRDSRMEPTRRLAELVANSPSCTTMVSASAIGYYGADRGDEELDESAEQGKGFLAEVVHDWEEATTPAAESGARTVQIRTGIVLSGRGGMLPPLRTLFSAGLGGNFGDGNFWMSWIAIDDITDIYVRAILDRQLQGPVNAVSPNPVLNRDLVTALSASMHRPKLFQIPSIGPRMVLGKEGSEQLAMADQKVCPRVLKQLNHHFRYPTIEAALAHELGHEELWGTKHTAELTEDNEPAALSAQPAGNGVEIPGIATGSTHQPERSTETPDRADAAKPGVPNPTRETDDDDWEDEAKTGSWSDS
ncbi:TIGR01777 family oxidoreductase [Corynebacterium sp. A21]|uniref:TIGR01777 family oxidoreductase n=1 Tax=Corynebacterium sp. A21 TaxID=3457318 RepID=UPI003FCF65E6